MHVIGHGIDLTDIDRIAAMLEEHGDRFRERCFTRGEQAYADSNRRSCAERYAARFACKEAVLKALGTGLRDGMRWTDIAVEHLPSGKPLVRLDGRCRKVADDLGVRAWHVSLSHVRGLSRASSGGVAVASVIACGDSA